MCNRLGCIVLSVLIVPILTCCNSFYSRGYGQGAVNYELPDTLDKNTFVAYLDTAAIDDWEGIWLLLGPEQHCFLAIERINNSMQKAVYTHRLRLWEPYYIGGIYRVEPGVVVGYLEQGIYDYEKRLSLYEGFFLSRRRYDTSVFLNETKRLILFEDNKRYKSQPERKGMKRVYPIKTHNEREPKVRYL